MLIDRLENNLSLCLGRPAAIAGRAGLCFAAGRYARGAACNAWLHEDGNGDARRRTFCGLTENAGHENDGPKLTAGRKVAEAEIQFKWSYHYLEVCKYLNPKHYYTVYT